MKVLGVDTSLTSTGLALIDANAKPIKPELKTARTRKTDGGFAEKLDRIWEQVQAVAEEADVDLVMLEGLSLNSTGNATRDLAGLWWMVLDELRTWCQVSIGIVPPASLKKWLTDNGNADKALMRHHIAQHWPRTEIRNHDQADALALASIGLHHLGSLPWHSTPYQEKQLSKVEWLHPKRVITV